MPVVALADQDFGSEISNVSRSKVSNFYLTPNPNSVSGLSYVPRPTLFPFSSVLTNPIRGLWYQEKDGVMTIYVVSGTKLLKMGLDGVTNEIGNISGSDVCVFASTIYSIAVVSEGRLYIYDGTTLSAVTVPDGNLVTDVTSLDNYFIIGIKDKNKFYWIRPGEVVINGLDFVSAERNPDSIESVMSIGDELWILGKETAEVFVDTGDAAAPFSRVSGRVYDVGCIDKTSVVRGVKDSLPCLIWVSSSCEVILTQGNPNKISNESVEEILRKADTFKAWFFKTSRHDFYVLTTLDATLVFDLTVGKWYRWSTYQSENWSANTGVQIGETTYVVDSQANRISKLTYNASDSVTDFLVCEVSGFLPNQSKNPVPCNSLSIFLNYGFSNSYTTNPLIELRWSDDGGFTWSDYVSNTTGFRGQYDTTAEFRSLGQIVRPGRKLELRFSEIQKFRLDGVVLND